ncbi:MAG: Bro-N domain-containing protein [Oscillospiraceae bacterium]|jgi:hypothetical protein|nr:Bro-N domain-containing protein [Oscillospiraceae bacterium]
MNGNNKIKVFEDSKIRAEWNEQEQDWYFSIVDVVGVLTDQSSQRGASNYWAKLKERLKNEGNELLTICQQLKMQSADGKFYKTDVANSKGILRIIQSIPSPKAEPFKMWLAQLGKERMDEIADPELAIDRAFQTYLKKGYSEKWINQRIKTLEVRKELTDEWKRSGIEKTQDYATLTDIMTKEWSGKTTREYKAFKGLKKENLRDHMTNMELVLNMLAEVSATDLSKELDPVGMNETAKVAKQGGSVAKAARKQYESQSGKKAISPLNAKGLKELQATDETSNADNDTTCMDD